MAAVMRLAGPLGMAAGLANATTKEEDATLEKSIKSEREKMAALTRQYGRETLEKAYKEQAPWYQVGGVDNARPDRVEAWVKAYMADKPAAASAAPPAAPAAPPDWSVMAPQNKPAEAPPMFALPPAAKPASPAAKPVAPVVKVQPAGQPAPVVNVPASAQPATPIIQVPPSAQPAAPVVQVTPPAANAPSLLAEKVVESSRAASDAAKAASEAATAAQNRPNNITQNNNYNVTVQAPAQPGALEMQAALDRALRDRERQKDAELRGSMLNQPRY